MADNLYLTVKISEVVVCFTTGTVFWLGGGVFLENRYSLNENM
jgi:hypothetical protein